MLCRSLTTIPAVNYGNYKVKLLNRMLITRGLFFREKKRVTSPNQLSFLFIAYDY